MAVNVVLESDDIISFEGKQYRIFIDDSWPRLTLDQIFSFLNSQGISLADTNFLARKILMYFKGKVCNVILVSFKIGSSVTNFIHVCDALLSDEENLYGDYVAFVLISD